MTDRAYRSIPALLLLLSAAAAEAQPAATPAAEPQRVRIGVGDPAIDASRLRPYSSRWRIVEIKPGGTRTEVERSTEKFERITWNGRRAWRQVQRETKGNSGVSGLTIIADYKSFAPILVESRDTRDGSFKRISYRGESVLLECAGHLCPPGMTPAGPGLTASRTTNMASAVFDFWGGSFGLLFAALPLSPNLAASVPVFHPVQGLIWLKVDVAGVEQADAGRGRRVAAYRVVTPQTGPKGWVYHVSTSPPYWLRLEYVMPEGTTQITERV